MTAPRPREQRRPPSPPDRPPPRRGGHTSPYTCAASAADRPAGPAHLAGARRGLVRSARALAAAALLALSGALPLSAQAQTTCTLNTGDIWCAVVTVGEYREGALPSAYGFSEAFSVGDLSDDSGDKSFTYGTNSYTVDIAIVGLEESNRALNFSLTGPLTDSDRAKLVLHVGSKSFPLGTADHGSAGYDYSWSRSGLDWSSATSVTLRLRVDPPPPPANLTASPGDRRVTLAWDAPTAYAGISRHEFRYKWRTTGDYGRWQAIPDSARGGANASGYTPPGASDDYPATGYPNLIDHVFQVRAVNAAGESGPSNEAAVTPLHPKAPPAPTVSVPANTAGLLEVSWTAVAGASAYEVRYWPADEDGRSFRTRWTRDTSALIQPLAANTEYRVSVAAQGGPWSEVATARTGAAQSGRPVLSLHLLSGSLSEIGEGAITEGGIVRYRIKATNIRNYHDWGNPGLLGHFRIRFDMEGDRHPPDPQVTWDRGGSKPLMRQGLTDTQPSFTQTSATTGYWDFVSQPFPQSSAEYGPLTLEIRRGPHRRDPDIGGSRSACVIINDNGLGPAYDYGSDDTMLTERPTYSCADRRSSRSLRGRFVSPPERHDGTNRVKVRVAFSEPVEESPENVGEHGVEVEGGEVTSVSPVGGDAPDGAGTRSVGGRNAGQQDREVVWEFEIEPDSDGDLTISLDAGRPCGEPGAICTADGRSLSEGISTTVEGPDTGPPPLTARFEDMPEAHDGESVFRFRVAFSENIGISYRSLREDAFTVTGGRVTRGRRVDGRRDLFEMTVEPDGEGDVTVTLPAGRACGVSGAICTKGENRRQLTNTPAATVAGPAVETGPAGLTAAFVGMPAEHRGEGGFRFRVAFSENIGISYRSLREDAFTVSGGRVTGGKRVDGRRDLFEMTVRPTSVGDVTITLLAGRACAVSGAICTKGEPRRRLTNTISATVGGPVSVSVADARAREGSDETIDFAVTLSRAASATVAVAYATADGSATAGSDYTARKGELTFDPGETEKMVRVPVLDDAIDEGEETFTLRLVNASGARIADGTATGTIENSDPLQKMWLSRFGRTVAGQVVDAVAGRLSGPAGGSQVTLGGQSIDLSSLSADTVDARRTLAGALGAAGAANDDDPLAGPGAWEAARAGAWEDPETGGTVRGMTGRELLLGSSFHLAAGGGEAGGPGYAAWGRVAVGGFDAEAPADNGTVRLDGEVTTGILGADTQWERWLAGVALSVSEGEGTFDQPGVDSGSVESSLTSVNPYVRYEASDRLSVWGLVGYGTGGMTMTQAARGERAEMVTRTDISMRLGAAGARGVLLEAGEDGGIDLALRGDAFLVQMDWEKVSYETDTRADASRLRLVLEAGRPFALGEGAVLTPGLELGLRHDGGDAETGTGVELGGRIRYTDAGSGLTVEANARTLVAHEDSGYREWGAGGSVRLDPGASGRGLSLSLSPVWGTPSSGVDRLWSARDAAGLVRDDDFDAERRLDGEVGYGFGAFGGHGLVTPYAGLGLAEAGDRTWRAGARWSLPPHLAMSLVGTRREPANDDEAPQHTLMLRGALRW